MVKIELSARETGKAMQNSQQLEPSCRSGERLRAARHAREWSLSQLVSYTGGALSKSRISNYEQGIRRLGSEEARILAAALGNVSVDYLLCRQDGPGDDPGEERLLLMYRSAPPDQRPALIEALHALVHRQPEEPDKTRASIDAADAQRQVAERWPDLELDASSFVGPRRRAEWICRRHGTLIKRSTQALLFVTEHPCSTCRAVERRAAERADPHAEQHLALLASTGDARAEEVYRLWLAGDTLSEIGRILDITPQGVDQRLDTISKRLREEGRGRD